MFVLPLLQSGPTSQPSSSSLCGHGSHRAAALLFVHELKGDRLRRRLAGNDTWCSMGWGVRASKPECILGEVNRRPSTASGARLSASNAVMPPSHPLLELRLRRAKRRTAAANKDRGMWTFPCPVNLATPSCHPRHPPLELRLRRAKRRTAAANKDRGTWTFPCPVNFFISLSSSSLVSNLHGQQAFYFLSSTPAPPGPPRAHPVQPLLAPTAQLIFASPPHGGFPPEIHDVAACR
jgi:hypothetical protein